MCKHTHTQSIPAEWYKSVAHTDVHTPTHTVYSQRVAYTHVHTDTDTDTIPAEWYSGRQSYITSSDLILKP